MPDDLADSSGYLWSWSAPHLAGFNVGNAPAGLGFPAFFDSGTQMQPLGQPVHQLHHLLMGRLPGLFNNLINRHRHSANLSITNQPLKAKARPKPHGAGLGRRPGDGRKQVRKGKKEQGGLRASLHAELATIVVSGGPCPYRTTARQEPRSGVSAERRCFVCGISAALCRDAATPPCTVPLQA